MALIWRRVLAAAIVTASISGAASSDATAAERVARDLGVVTYNQYLGADLTPLLVAPAGQFNAALLGVLEKVAANRFPAAGYVDTWLPFRGSASGFTCCQAADLRNLPSELFKRIDFVLAGTGPLSVRDIHRIGEPPTDRTPGNPGRPRLWPSDHAGVAASLRF